MQEQGQRDRKWRWKLTLQLCWIVHDTHSEAVLNHLVVCLRVSGFGQKVCLLFKHQRAKEVRVQSYFLKPLSYPRIERIVQHLKDGDRQDAYPKMPQMSNQIRGHDWCCLQRPSTKRNMSDVRFGATKALISWPSWCKLLYLRGRQVNVVTGYSDKHSAVSIDILPPPVLSKI